MCYCSYMSMSGFFTILPYLVSYNIFINVLCSLSNIVLMFSSCLCLLMSCIPFVSLFVSGIILLLGLSFVIILVVGGSECL